MAKRRTLNYDKMGDNHPKVEEVRAALAGQGDMPGGLSINFHRGAAWLMDADDAATWEAERAGAGYDVGVGAAPADTDFDAGAPDNAV
jgi:hypothetical protein